VCPSAHLTLSEGCQAALLRQGYACSIQPDVVPPEQGKLLFSFRVFALCHVSGMVGLVCGSRWPIWFMLWVAKMAQACHFTLQLAVVLSLPVSH
jgi:hypothetical protein